MSGSISRRSWVVRSSQARDTARSTPTARSVGISDSVQARSSRSPWSGGEDHASCEPERRGRAPRGARSGCPRTPGRRPSAPPSRRAERGRASDLRSWRSLAAENTAVPRAKTHRPAMVRVAPSRSPTAAPGSSRPRPSRAGRRLERPRSRGGTAACATGRASAPSDRNRAASRRRRGRTAGAGSHLQLLPSARSPSRGRGRRGAAFPASPGPRRLRPVGRSPRTTARARRRRRSRSRPRPPSAVGASATAMTTPARPSRRPKR